jgi:hypothetical protein
VIAFQDWRASAYAGRGRGHRRQRHHSRRSRVKLERTDRRDDRRPCHGGHPLASTTPTPTSTNRPWKRASSRTSDGGGSTTRACSSISPCARWQLMEAARLPRLFDGRAAAHRHHHCHGDRLRPRGCGAPGGRVRMCLYMGLGYGSWRWYNDDGIVVKYPWGEEAGPRWGEHRPLHR